MHNQNSSVYRGPNGPDGRRRGVIALKRAEQYNLILSTLTSSEYVSLHPDQDNDSQSYGKPVAVYTCSGPGK